MLCYNLTLKIWNQHIVFNGINKTVVRVIDVLIDILKEKFYKERDLYIVTILNIEFIVGTRVPTSLMCKRIEQKRLLQILNRK